MNPAPRPLRWLLLALLSAFAMGVRAADGCDDLSGQPINFNVRWPQVWQALDQQASCTQNCHLGSQPTGDLDLSNQQISIYFLVEQMSFQAPSLARVAAGNPRASLFFQKITCSFPDVGGPMPPGVGHLPPALSGLIYDWIEQGAYGEDTEDPIPRDFAFRDSLESLRR